MTGRRSPNLEQHSFAMQMANQGINRRSRRSYQKGCSRSTE